MKNKPIRILKNPDLETKRFQDGIEGGGSTPSGINYSTTEQAVGKWIDDKTLYQKTISIASIPKDTSFQSFAHNISSIDTIASCEAICKQSDGDDTWYTIPMTRDSTNILAVSVTKTDVNILNTWYAMIDGRVTIRYTKTTT